MFERHRGWLTGLWLVVASTASWAQGPAYQCSANGQTWLSRTPCQAPSSGGTVLRQYGAVPERPSYPQRNYSVHQQAADAHTKYLPTECANISEGIRTGPSRGVPHGVITELRAEYQRKCQDDDREARNRASEDDKRQRDERRAMRDAEQSVRAQATRQTAQCDEMLGALAAKRRRLDTLTAGEREDLARFQARYDERCKR